MKTKKILIWSGLLLAAGIAAWFFYKKWKVKQATTAAGSIPASSPAANIVSLNLTDNDFPLERGDRGRQVLFLQAWMETKKSSGLKLDGVFGPATEAAVKTHYNKIKVERLPYNMTVKPLESDLLAYLVGKGIKPSAYDKIGG